MQNVSRRRFSLVILGFVFALVAVLSNGRRAEVSSTETVLLPPVTATNVVTITNDGVPGAEAADGKADPGEILEYTVTVSNGASDATGVALSTTLQNITTFVGGSVAVSPAAGNDTLPVSVTGNVAINTALMAVPFSVLTNDFQGSNVSPGLTIVAFDATTANGGQIVMTTSGANIGKFTYDPPAGFEGADTFTYTLSDNTNAPSPATNRTATVTLNVSGMVWFINNNAAACTANGCGRLSNPYSTLASFNTANDGVGNHPNNNDNIFIYESATAYTGGIALRSGQKLLGQDSTSTLSTLTGITPVTGSSAFPAMNTGAPATTIQNAGGHGIGLLGNSTLSGFTAGTSSGTAINGGAIGTLTVSDVIINTTGAALNLGSGTFAGSGFISTTSSGGLTNVTTSGTSGTINLGSGSLSGASANAVNIIQGTPSVNYSGTISGAGSYPVRFFQTTGGNSTFSGAISGTGLGISLDTNTGATFTFNGGINLNTTANAAFTAVGGGTVNVCDEAACNPNATGSLVNTLSTTTATALNVQNTTIGGNNLEFRSVSSSGGSNTGIILISTGTNPLQVKGTGGTARGGDSSGGTITNKTGGTDGDGTTASAVYINNGAATLRNMTFTRLDNFGLYGLSVNNVTLQYSSVGAISGSACADADGDIGTSTGAQDAAIVFGKSNPSGLNGFNNGSTVLLDNLRVFCSIEHQIEMYAQSNSFTATVTNSDIKDNSTAGGSDGVQIEMQGTANGNIDVNSNSFDDNKSQAIQAAANDSSTLDMTANSNTVVKTAQGNEGMVFSNGSSGDLILHALNNNISGIGGVAIFVGQTPGNATAASFLSAVIQGNIINHPTTATNSAIIAFLTSCGAGASPTCPAAAAPANILINSNTVTENSTGGVSRAILVDTPDINGIPTYTATVTNNITSVGDNIAGVVPIVVQGRQTAGTQACFDVRSNSASFPNGNPGVAGVRVRQVTATVQLEPGSGGGTAASALATNNPAATTEVLGTVTLAPNNSTCQNAPTFAPQTEESPIAKFESMRKNAEMAAALVEMAYGNAERRESFFNTLKGNAALRSANVPSLPSDVEINAPGVEKPSAKVADPSAISEFISAIGRSISPTVYSQNVKFDVKSSSSPLSGETVTTSPTFNVPANKNIVIKYRATVDSGPYQAGVHTIDNQATVSGSNFSNVATNTASVPLDAAPDLTISATDGATETQPGVIALYNLSYANATANNGQNTAQTRLSVQVPVNTSFNSASSGSGWSCADGATNPTVCTNDVGALAAGGGGTKLIAFNISGNLPATALTIAPTATIAENPANDNGTDRNPPDNTITDTNTVRGVWLGGTSADWAVNTNWSNNLLPNSAQNISIPTGGGANSPSVNSADVTVGNIVFSGKNISISAARTLLVNGSATLAANNVNGAGTLELASGAPITRTTGQVNCALKKNFINGNLQVAPDAVFVFPVGTATGYSPVTANVSGTSTGSLTVKANDGTAPSTPALADATTLDRYWQLTKTGALTADLTFAYIAADVDGTESNYRLIRTVTGAVPRNFANGTPCPGAGSPCVDAGANTIFAAGVQVFDNFWTAGEPVAPTAANVGVSGRVLDRDGIGLSRARVQLTDQSGRVVYAMTNPFGHYRFVGVPAGQDYVMTVDHKAFTFQSRIISVTDELTEVDISPAGN